ncbi:MAG: hypothetical protein CMK41_04975 [Porticoccaceae bacterium]|nr:hypothetical protein [Porticoccaceae bacterium]
MYDKKMQRVYLTFVFSFLFMVLIGKLSFWIFYWCIGYFDIQLTYQELLKLEDIPYGLTLLGLVVGGIGAWKFFNKS